jgi:sirohydrochlorin cobaltochelatase
MAQGLLLIGHGSRDRSGNEQFLALADRLASRTAADSGAIVEPCFLDHAEPDVGLGIERLVARGATQIGVVPLFLFAAGHAKHDVPLLLEKARLRHPGVGFKYGRHLGVHTSLIQVCSEQVGLIAGDPAQTAVVLVGRGSSDPDANSDLYKVARLLWEETHLSMVEIGYCDVTRPTVPEALARVLQLGARRVVLLPYFLFRGVLMERMRALLAVWQEAHPAVSFALAAADGLGSHPSVLELVVARANEVLGS